MKGRMENGGLFKEYEGMQEKLRKRPKFPETAPNQAHYWV